MNTGMGRRRKRSVQDVFNLDRLEEILCELEFREKHKCGYGFKGFLLWMQEIVFGSSGFCVLKVVCEGKDFVSNHFSSISQIVGLLCQECFHDLCY